MFNLIKADLYKSFHRAYLYVIIICLAGLAVLVNVIVAQADCSAEKALQLILQLLVYPLFLICLFSDMTTAEENKEHSLKNTIAAGVSRSKVYFAKQISTLIIGLITGIITIGVYTASDFLLMRSDGSLSQTLSTLMPYLGTAFLCYIAACFLSTALAFIVKKNALFSISYFGILVFPVLLFRLLNYANPIFLKFEELPLFMQTNSIMTTAPEQLINIVWVAAIHLVVFCFGGLLIFHQQEVN